MTTEEEQAYEAGWRTAWAGVLMKSAGMLGVDDPEAQKVAWVVERELTVHALRDLCAVQGDNDWPHDSNLSDVVSKHVRRHPTTIEENYLGVCSLLARITNRLALSDEERGLTELALSDCQATFSGRITITRTPSGKHYIEPVVDEA